MGITGYIHAIRFSNPPEKYGFSYDPQQDAFICPEGTPLTYHRLNCNKSTAKYLRCYQVDGDICMRCPKRPGCFDKAGVRRRILTTNFYPAFYRGHQRVGAPEFLAMIRLRKIWAEGSFSVLKREHCISKIQKRGIPAATEECLLDAMALNLKRMAKAAFYELKILFCWAGDLFLLLSFLLLSTGSLYFANFPFPKHDLLICGKNKLGRIKDKLDKCQNTGSEAVFIDHKIIAVENGRAALFFIAGAVTEKETRRLLQGP